MFLNRKKLLILLYHGVEEKIDWGIFNYRKKFILPESFSRQLEYLKRNYTILELDKAVELFKNGNLPDHSAVITFDDGYQNFFEFAYPALKKNSLPATVFLSANFIDKKIPLWVDRVEFATNHLPGRTTKEKIGEDIAFRDRLKKMAESEKEEEILELESRTSKLDDFENKKRVYSPLNWDQIRQMHQNGINFGAHGMDHSILTRIPPDQAQEEIEGSKALILEKIGHLSKIYCYPNGQKDDFDVKIEKILQSSGFKSALTTLPGFNSDISVFSLKRIVLDGTDDFSVFLANISGIKDFIKNLIWKNT